MLQHVRHGIQGEYKGSALWLQPMDAQGLGPVTTHRVPNLDGRHLTAPCRADQGACYLERPYYFPVAQYMPPSWWIPTDPPPLLPGRRLRVIHHAKWDMVMGVCEIRLQIQGDTARACPGTPQP